MNSAGGAVGGGQEEEELPLSDGTCDACEPDEAQPAAEVCRACGFAFCPVHADKHRRSTRHTLEPHSQGESAAFRPLTDGQPGPGPQGGEREKGAAERGSDKCGGAEGAEDEEVGLAVLESGKSRDTVTVERLRCKEHGQEGSLYCKNDEKIICVVCAVQGEHSTHEIITLREAYLWQKSKGGIDLLGSTQEMAERIKSKWTSPGMSTDQLEAYVNEQFDELHRLVRLEERRTLHLVDLKEAFLTAQAAEKIAEITVHTERLQEEMDSITQQLGALDQGEEAGPSPGPADPEARPRPEPRQDPPRDYGDSGAGSFMGHAP
ncbi:tripartite motif-containing protein 44 isoform X1 [Megalops cyprinoides]|uniref:tripartite motif-containing protein 44 isoform X1 n=1 Tax=Megalops cyprinoides TaxID=118141 RepID=UPI001865285F|nr:tripartite motif-containing protein 44 isoform X1 [Megalops cyprinoides]